MLTLEATQTLAGVCSQASAVTYTVFGRQTSAPAIASPTPPPRVMAQGQLPSTAATIYTVPESGYAEVSRVTLVNTLSSDVTIQLFVGGVAAANAITPVITIPGGGWGEFGADGWKVYDKTGSVFIRSSAVEVSLASEDVDLKTMLEQVLMVLRELLELKQLEMAAMSAGGS